MNAKTSKLIRRVSHRFGYIGDEARQSYRTAKKVWNSTPRTERHAARLEMLEVMQ